MPESPGGRRPPGRRTAVAAILAALLAPVAACSSMPPAPPPNPALLPPIYAALYGTTEANSTVSAAEQLLTARCMARRGFHYKPTVSADAGVQDRPRPFGLESLASSVTARKAPATQKDSPAERHGSTDRDYAEALLGSPSDRIEARGRTMTVSRPGHGCLAEAEKHLLGDDRRRWIKLRIELYEAEVAARDQLQKNRTFRDLNRRWSSCIKSARFHFKNPLELLDKLPRDADLKTDTSAKADLKCKNDTKYLALAYTGLAAAQRRELRRTPAVLPDWTALLRRQCLTAQQILAAHGGKTSPTASCPKPPSASAP